MEEDCKKGTEGLQVKPPIPAKLIRSALERATWSIIAASSYDPSTRNTFVLSDNSIAIGTSPSSPGSSIFLNPNFS